MCWSENLSRYLSSRFGSADGFKWVVANPDETVPGLQYVVKQLKEGYNYEFRVAAENRAGVGPASDPTAPVQVKEPVSEYPHRTFCLRTGANTGGSRLIRTNNSE